MKSARLIISSVVAGGLLAVAAAAGVAQGGTLSLATAAAPANAPNGGDQLINSQANGGVAYIVLLSGGGGFTELFGTTTLTDSPKFYSTAETGNWWEWKVVGYPGQCVYIDATYGFVLKPCDRTKASDLWESSSPNFYSQMVNQYLTTGITLLWGGYGNPISYSPACGTCAAQHWHWANVA